MRTEPWLTEDEAAVQLERAACVLRAGLGGAVIRAIRCHGEAHFETLEIRGFGRAIPLLTRVAVGLGWHVSILDGSGSGSGYGSGSGSGYGDGDGYGSGSGSGYGDGDGSIEATIYLTDAPMSTPDKSQPLCLRHHKAGVYLGYLQPGDGDLPGTRLWYCRHVWRWDRRLGVTAIAHAGPGHGSSAGPWVWMSIPIEETVATIRATPEAMAALDALPVALEQAR